MRLVGITDCHGFTHFESSLVDAFHAHDHLEQGGFTGPVRTDHADDAVRRQHEVEIVKQQFAAECLCHVLGFDYLVA